MLRPRQRTIDMTAGSFGPTCYRVTRSPATQQAVHRTNVLHSQVAPPIILSCCYVSECWFEHDHIAPSASFTL
jgi:hypothetical protein